MNLHWYFDKHNGEICKCIFMTFCHRIFGKLSADRFVIGGELFVVISVRCEFSFPFALPALVLTVFDGSRVGTMPALSSTTTSNIDSHYSLGRDDLISPSCWIKIPGICLYR